MLEKVYGSTKKQAMVRPLSEGLDRLNLNGTLYIGYPILASADESITLDALLLTREHGLIAFIFSENEGLQTVNGPEFWEGLRDAQDKLYFAIEANLKRHLSLRRGRNLGIKIQVITLFPQAPLRPDDYLEIVVTDPNTLQTVLIPLPALDEDFIRPLNAALQRVTTIKPAKKRISAVRNGSRGSILKEIEKQIANLDRWQKQAAIETPEGPQRIRGLAGSGKTVVLALKAAYLHAQNPDWNIVLTFHTRSLYQQLVDLVRRFCFEHLGDEPNWEKLHIIHAWGGASRPGVYTQMADHAQVPVRDFLYGKARFGWDNAFQGVCEELVAATANGPTEPIYDAMLVDEAQDLPWQFFRLIYRFTREPKRIVWAYDELQHLSEAAMPTLKDLFGVDDTGELNISLDAAEGEPRRDIILPVCYRNTPWSLTVAHALGFGIYRDGGLVQHFDEPALWEEIGYRPLSGQLALGESVTLERDPNSYPTYFKELLNAPDAVSSHVFRTEVEQAEWIAENIRINLSEDELEISDIFIVLPSAITAAKTSLPIIDALARKKINAHLVGTTTSRDEIFSNNSIAITHIHRAKGNEAPMVYVVNSQSCYKGYELIRLRNTLFTAITRCRGWVRICGFGDAMEALKKEIDKVQQNYRLSFKIPTLPQLAKLRQIHRDRTASEKAKVKKAEKGLSEFLKAFAAGEITLDNLPPALREQLLRNLGQMTDPYDDDPQQTSG
jgi:superfamily I DNA and RNA helicase